MCNLAMTNGGDAGLSENTKRAKITITKSEGMKIVGDFNSAVRAARKFVIYWKAFATKMYPLPPHRGGRLGYLPGEFVGRCTVLAPIISISQGVSREAARPNTPTRWWWIYVFSCCVRPWQKWATASCEKPSPNHAPRHPSSPIPRGPAGDHNIDIEHELAFYVDIVRGLLADKWAPEDW